MCLSYVLPSGLPSLSPLNLHAHPEMFPQPFHPLPLAFPTSPLTMETEPGQKDVDILIPSAHTAAEEPEASVHSDPIEDNVEGDSMEANEAPTFSMLRFLREARAAQAVQAAVKEHEREKPDNWADFRPTQKNK